MGMHARKGPLIYWTISGEGRELWYNNSSLAVETRKDDVCMLGSILGEPMVQNQAEAYWP